MNTTMFKKIEQYPTKPAFCKMCFGEVEKNTRVENQPNVRFVEFEAEN